MPCPPGTFNTFSGKSSPLDCIKIDGGKYIGTEGARENTGKPCEAGFRCDLGASMARPGDESSGHRVANRKLSAAYQ